MGLTNPLGRKPREKEQRWVVGGLGRGRENAQITILEELEVGKLPVKRGREHFLGEALRRLSLHPGLH